jgi:predicted transcriptional regulator YdeE
MKRRERGKEKRKEQRKSLRASFLALATALVSWTVFAITAASSQIVSTKDSAMAPKVTEEAGFTVIGIAERTTNAKEMTPDGIIGKQWARFIQENLLAQIPNRVDSSILAVITDYASDKDGEYTHLIGAKVTSATEVPPGMVVKKVPPGRYAVFTSEKGPVAKVVVATWVKIWSIPKSSPGGDRAYKADYEVYDQRAANPQDAQVDVHIGIH